MAPLKGDAARLRVRTQEVRLKRVLTARRLSFPSRFWSLPAPSCTAEVSTLTRTAADFVEYMGEEQRKIPRPDSKDRILQTGGVPWEAQGPQQQQQESTETKQF